MEPVKKLLVMCAGLECDAMISAIKRTLPTRIIIIHLKKHAHESIGKQVDDAIKKVRDESSKIARTLGIDEKQYIEDLAIASIDSIPETFATVYNILRKFQKDGWDIIVDITSGPRVVAIPLYIASSLLGIEVTYTVPLKKYIGKLREDEDLGLAYWIILDPLPLNLTKANYAVLDALLKMGGKASLTEIVRKLQGKNKGEKVEKKELMATLRDIRTLMAYGYIRECVSSKTSRKEYELTPQGKKMACLAAIIRGE